MYITLQIIHRPAPPSSGRLTPASSTTTPAPATRRGSSTPRPRDRKPPHRARQPRRTVCAAGRLAPDSDRGVCPVLRRLRGGRFHHRRRVGGAALCRARLIRLRVGTTPVTLAAPDGYSSREPGYKGPKHGFSCHEETGDGIELDGDTCDRDWFRVMLTVNRTYKLQLESGTDVLIDGVYRHGSLFQKGGGNYTARSTSIHYISVAGTNGCTGLHGCTGSYTLSVTRGVAPLGRRLAAVRCQRGSLLIAVASNGRQPTPSPRRPTTSICAASAGAGWRTALPDRSWLTGCGRPTPRGIRPA